MTKRLNAAEVKKLLSLLRRAYPEASIALVHQNPYQLLAATILSAQCTDERVNQVTPVLFAAYPTPADLAAADAAAVEQIIRSTGFFRNKTKSLLGMAQALVERHQGCVPKTMEELIKLPGVARKTANVVLGSAFGIASGVVVDTHVIRLTGLLGLSRHQDPGKIEQDLMLLLPQQDWIAFSHMLIHHGRRVCVARRPRCPACSLSRLCPSAFRVPHASGAAMK